MRKSRLIARGLDSPNSLARGPELRLLHRWLDSWHGVGLIVAGMHRQAFDVQLTQYDDRGWRATFDTSGMEHSPTGATGSAWEATPGRAVQRAAWGALQRGEN